MERNSDGHWDTLHAQRPLWYAYVWRACAALESWVTETAAASQPQSSHQESDPHAIAIRMRTRLYLLAEEQKTSIETRSLLLLALEDPALAETSPASFDAVRQNMHAAYLLGEQCAQRLAGELARYWEDREEGLLFATLPLPAPLPAVGSPSSAPLDPDTLSQGVRLAERAFDAWQSSIQRERRSPPDFAEVLAMVMECLKAAFPAMRLVSDPPAVGYRGSPLVPPGHLTWSQRLEKARRALDGQLACMAQQEGEPPAEVEALQMAKECADEAAYGECDTRSLILLALEVPWFALGEPANYAVLQADQQDGEVKLTAAYLISEHVYLEILEMLEEHLGEWYHAYWSERPDCCEVCGGERGDALWAPFAGLPFTFVPLAEQQTPANLETRLVLRIGEGCMHALEYGGTIAFACDEQHFCANRSRGVFPVGGGRT